MKRNSTLLLVSALALAAGTALVARVLMTPPPVVAAPAAAPKAVTYVLVANHDLMPGDFINAMSLHWVEAGDRKLPAGAYVATDAVKRGELARAFFGATIRRDMTDGQAITPDMPVYPGQPGFLAAVLAPGMRAISIPTSALSSNSGLVSAGDWVDVILSLDRDAKGTTTTGDADYGKLASQTVLRNVRVLALNSNAVSIAPPDVGDGDAHGNSRDPRSAKAPVPQRATYETMTLEVTPEAAERLAVAKEVGTLQVALRGLRQDDKDNADEAPAPGTHVTRLADTTQIFKPSAGSTAPSVTVYQGTKQSKVTFANAQ